MSSIMTTSSPDRYAAMRHYTRKDLNPVRPRYRYVLELHLAGYKVEDRELPDGSIIQGIKSLTGYSTATIYKILNDPSVIALRQQIMQHHDKEFEAQYRKVVDAVDRCLDPLKPDEVKLKAAKLWGEFHKKFQKVEVNQNINITAEDIVFKIMNGTYEGDTNPAIDITPNGD